MEKWSWYKLLCFLSVNAVRSLAIAIYPFMPDSSQKIWVQLGLEGNVSTQMFDQISNITLNQGHKLGSVSPLFEKLRNLLLMNKNQSLETVTK